MIETHKGTPEGCANRVFEGVEPNEYGTWLYGRDGWCDGQEVTPLEWDITSSISMDPSTPNTVIYFGYYQDHTPDPTENPGYIIMHSFLVYYKSP